MLKAFSFLSVFLLAGCVSTDHPEPYSEVLLGSISKGITARSEIESLLGPPSAVRRGGDIWIYGQSRLQAIVLGPGPGIGGIDDFNWLLVEFSGDIVTRFESVDEGWGCATTGICLLSYYYERGQETSQPELTVVTSTQKDDELAKLFRSVPERCAVYLYSSDAAGEVSFNRKNSIQIVGSSYVFDIWEPGTHKVSITAKNAESSEIQLTCKSGDVLFLELFYGQHIWSGKPKIMEVNTEEGRKAIVERSLVLLP